MSGGVVEEPPRLHDAHDSNCSEGEEPSSQSGQLFRSSVRVAGSAFGARIHQEPEQTTETLTGEGCEGERTDRRSRGDHGSSRVDRAAGARAED